MNISKVYEDENIIIVDKPAGITVNRADTTRNEQTLQDWAEDRLGEEYRKLQIQYEKQRELLRDEKEKTWDPVMDFYSRGGIVHRLDKETSGVLVLAKNPDAFIALQRQFKERIVQKEYVALAHGRVVPSEGEISVPVGRLPWNRMQFGVVPGGRESLTFYKVTAYYQNRKNKEIFSYIELSPKTGRTHQIRVHLKYIGHPIFADFLYAGRKTARNDRKLLERVFLHAAKISFHHPKTDEEVLFTSPLPEELSAILKHFELLSD